MVFTHRLAVGSERKKEVQDDCKVFNVSNWLGIGVIILRRSMVDILGEIERSVGNQHFSTTP